MDPKLEALKVILELAKLGLETGALVDLDYAVKQIQSVAQAAIAAAEPQS